jgi:hypothetical protein
MKRLDVYASTLTRCAALLLVAVFIHAGNAVAAPATANVNVVNTPDVNVVNTPNVNVANSTLSVRDAAHPAYQPFQAQAQFAIPTGDSAITFVIATVPAGKRLVIEYATVLAEAGAGTLGARIQTTADGNFAAHHLVLAGQGPLFGVPAFTASQTMRVYADPNTAVTGIVNRSETTGTAGGQVSISGHLVDIP